MNHKLRKFKEIPRACSRSGRIEIRFYGLRKLPRVTIPKLPKSGIFF